MSATFLIHDLWKGFDITNEESSWRLMIHYGIQQKYINLVKTMLCEVLSLSSSSSFTSICINLNTEGNLYGFIQNWNYLYGFTQSWSNLNDLLKTQETCGFTQSWRNLYGCLLQCEGGQSGFKGTHYGDMDKGLNLYTVSNNIKFMKSEMTWGNDLIATSGRLTMEWIAEIANKDEP